MLTSLLSIYIASSIEPQLSASIDASLALSPNIVKTADSDFKSTISNSPIPIKNPKYISPIINASSSISIDATTGTVLYEKNPHTRRPIASITKLMTALIILEENQLDEIVTVSNNATAAGGSEMFLRSGEQITVESLLYGIIIHSANDAAIALAEHNAGSVDEFVAKMNSKALELGLLNSQFANPNGLDQAGSYSSAFDVAKLAKIVYQDNFIQKAAQTKAMEVRSATGEYLHKLESTNDLLDSYLNIKGLKTGKTDAAGLCLVSVAENQSSNEIITVVLNSPARFTETKVLTDWTFRAYNWQN